MALYQGLLGFFFFFQISTSVDYRTSKSWKKQQKNPNSECRGSLRVKVVGAQLSVTSVLLKCMYVPVGWGSAEQLITWPLSAGLDWFHVSVSCPLSTQSSAGLQLASAMLLFGFSRQGCCCSMRHMSVVNLPYHPYQPNNVYIELFIPWKP